METLRRARTRSRNECTTRLLSFSERAPGIDRVIRATPTNMRSERLTHLFELVGLDGVAFLEVLEAFERHTAIEAFLDLSDVVLEALETRQLARPEHRPVAHQSNAAV